MSTRQFLARRPDRIACLIEPVLTRVKHRRGWRSGLFGKPAPENIEHILLVVGRQFLAWRDRVPFLQAAAAAGGRGVLSHEDGVVAHRSLPAVIERMSGGQPLGDEPRAVLENRLEALTLEVITFLRGGGTGVETPSATVDQKVHPDCGAYPSFISHGRREIKIACPCVVQIRLQRNRRQPEA